MTSHTTRLRTLPALRPRPKRFLLQIVFLISLVALLSLPILTRAIARSSGATNATDSSGETQNPARLSENASVRALGRRSPLINLGDGHEVLTSYFGPEDLQQALAQNQTQPLSLASADFDEDGVPDLVAGYGYQGQGIVSLFSGNADTIYPNSAAAQQHKRAGAFTNAPFSGAARLLQIETPPDFIGVGDFDADGHWDLVAATRGQARLWWLRGDGKGNFAAATKVDLDSSVTALVTGEMNQADGLNDVVVGVASDKGAELLIFADPAGALKGRAEAIALPGASSALVLGQFDNDSAMDVAVAAGHDLMLVSGRYRPARRDSAASAAAKIERRRFDYVIKSLAYGSFNSADVSSLALLANDGTVHLLHPAAEGQAADSVPILAAWQDERVGGGQWSGAETLLRLKVSDFPGDDLLVIEAERKQLSVLAGDKLLAQTFDGDMKATSTKVPGVITSLVTEKTPAAFLSMRLDADALDDLVMLTGGSAAPATLTTQDSGLLNAQVANAPGVNDYSVLGNGGRPVVLPGNSKANLEANRKTSPGKAMSGAPGGVSPHFGGCPSVPINYGQALPGTLTGSDCFFTNGSFFDSYSFSGHAGEQVAVVLISGNFDTFLYLLGPDDVAIGIDDDGNGGTDSRIPATNGYITLPANGTYTILVSSFAAAATGDYLVSLAVNATSCTPTVMIYDQIYNGSLSATDCPATNGAYSDIYTFQGFAQQQIAVEMTAGTFDTLLYLYDPSGALLAVGDDANVFDSRIPRGGDFITLPSTGTYYVIASSFSARLTGDYQVRVLNNAGPCTFTAIAYGDTLNGAMNPNCNPFGDGHYANGYTFFGIAGQPIVIQMSSTEVDSFLSLYDPNNNLIASDDDSGGGLNARIPISGFGLLPLTGLYTIFATTAGPFDTGAFQISLNVDVAGSPTVVTNTNDSGVGSLRQALLNANANPGANTISFNIAGPGVKTVSPLSTLPPVTGPVTIDGTTQPGYAGVPLIEINGQSAGPRTVGLKILGGNSRIRGLVINSFSIAGIALTGPGGNLVDGNYIGTDPTGTVGRPVPPHEGLASQSVIIDSSSNNTIGGTTAAARNIISGSEDSGVLVQRSARSFPQGNLVRGNYIGLAVNGTARVPNNGNGVEFLTGTNNIIGGTVAGARNVISGNIGPGIALGGFGATTGNLVQGNYIGTNAAGSAAAPNGAGVIVGGIILFSGEIIIASRNLIGGTTVAARNVVSGNAGDGLELNNTGSIENNVQGNFIGSDATGTAALGNTGSGVLVTFANGNVIGGAAAGAGNMIVSNGAFGVGVGLPLHNPLTGEIIAGGKGVDIIGNFIGTNAAGTAQLGNVLDGIFIAADAVQNTIANNSIAFNGRNGVFIPKTTPGSTSSNPGLRNNLDTNLIYQNASLGIDLQDPGITANDLRDTDAGANLQQNFPSPLSFGAASVGEGIVAGQEWFLLNGPEVPLTTDAISVTAQLNSTPSTTFVVNWYFSSGQCVNSQQGSRPLAFGRIPGITTNSNGDATFNFAFDFPPGFSSGVINTTATDPVGNTSEFSGCLPVNATPPSIQFSASGYSVNEGGVSATITVTRSGATGGASSIDFATSDGSATQNQDYVVSSGTISFAAGETSKTFSLLIVDDAFVESSESINLTLSNPTGATLAAPSTATLSITDNDTAGSTSPAAKRFAALLDGAQQIPTNSSQAQGTGYVLLNQSETSASVSLRFQGLGSAETGAHIHGPAAAGASAPAVFTLPNTNPVINFQISPTAGQVANLKAGLHYLDAHSTNFSNGEIRGQLRWSPTLEENFFVRQQYLDFLSRDGDPGGFSFWVNQVGSCGADAQCLHDRTITTSNAFFFEPEFQQTAGYVFRAYRAAFGNNQPFPNPDGSNATEANKLIDYAAFVADRARVVGGANLAQAQQDFANQFSQRPAFMTKYAAATTAGQFVDAILATVQTADAVNLSSQRQALIDQYNNAGGGNPGRAMVLYRLADDNAQSPINNQAFINAEYNRQFALTLYFGYLRRNPDIGGFLFWQSQINLAPIRDVPKQNALVCSFLTAAEYQLRFGPNAPRSNAECPQ